MAVVPIEVPALGNRAYVVHDGRSAVVVDPPRDLSAVERVVEDAGVDIVAVAETHVHNDYVSGGLALARRHGSADLLLSAQEQVDFERVGVSGGDVLGYGDLEVEVVDTPGHTRHHQSFVVRAPGQAPALLSGGSLLLGTVGRTDLVDPRLAVNLAGRQWDSALAQATLDPETRLLPTHGFGSFCAGGAVDTSEAETATIGSQLRTNTALTTPREEFVATLVAGFGPIPGHYPHMDPLNRAGAGATAPRPARRVTAADVDEAVRRGAWVVDLRDRASYAAGHLAGTVGVEYSAQFATYAGWLVPWGHDLVLLGDDSDQLADAVTDLAGIGIEGMGVHQLPAASEQSASYRRTDWQGFRDEAVTADRVVVDVRQRDEWDAGHLPGAIHLPVQDVPGARLPDGQLWVHCRSGYRAGIAASVLHRDGRDVVHVDDDWDRVAELSLPTTAATAAA